MTRPTRLVLVMVWLVAMGLAGCKGAATPTAAPEAALPPTVAPSNTPRPPTATLPPTVTPAPSDTPLPPSATPTASVTRTATPTQTSTPTQTATPTQTLMPTLTPTPALPAATAKSPSNASPGAMADRPKGSSLAYEPEFPAVSPASAPPAYDAATNPLTGLPAANPGALQRRALLVRFGNDRAARPHSGVAQAEVMMEELMDAWWITRLTGVYLEQEPQKVGPLRSARPFVLDAISAFDGVLVYSGASIGMTQLLAAGGYNLVNETQDGDLFFRGSDRPSPHNLYTSIPAVRQRVQERGWDHPSALRGFAFATEAPAGASATRVDIPYPATSVVRWTWDAGAGVYLRWVQDAAYTDLNTGEQVGCENVIVVYARHWESDIVEDSRGATAIGIALRGGGRVQVLRDGRMLEGYWWRAESSALFQFIDGSGNHIPLKPGRTWIEFVPTTCQLDMR